MPHEPQLPNLRAVVYSVLAVIAMFGGGSNILLARETAQIQQELALVSVTGRQQVLAEQVARYARQRVTALAPQDRQQAHANLRRSVAEMRRGHQDLVQAPEFRPSPGSAHSPLTARLSTEVEGYLAAANSILLTPDAQLARRNADVRGLERQASGPLVAVLDEVHALMERQNAEHVRRINLFAWLRFSVVLTSLLVLALVVFRPLDRRIRHAQADLRRERDFAQQIMTTVAQGLSVTDPQGRFEYVNPAYARLLNVTPESLLGRTPFEITFEEDHPALLAAKAQRDSGQTSTYETRLKRADGTGVPVLVTGAPRVAGGFQTGTIASITDLTQQKLNEQTVRTLAALSHSLEQEATPEGVTERTLEVLSQAMELTWLALCVLKGDRFCPLAFSGTMPPGLRERMELGVARGEGAIWETLTGNAVYLEESRIPAYVALGVSSVALVPLPASAQGVTQVLCAYRGGDARPWGARERVLLETATRSMAAALSRAELHQQAQEAAEYAQTLLAISALVEGSVEPAMMAQQALRLLGPAVKLDRGCLLVVRGQEMDTVTAWSRMDGPQEIQDQREPLEEQGFREQIGQVLKTGQPAYIDDYRQELGASAVLVAQGVRSIAWIPLASVQDTHYLFSATRLHQDRAWSLRDRELLAAAARTVRVAFERHEHLRLLEYASLTDLLTGLGNRRALEKALEKWTARDHEPLGVISIDLDGLKQINDTLGHEWGDLLLREFGRALQETIRLQDQVYRPGGDEFVILLPGCRPEQAEEMLARVQRAAEQVRRRPELQTCGASAGVAFKPEDGQTAASLMSRADERMYQSKRQRKQQALN